MSKPLGKAAVFALKCLDDPSRHQDERGMWGPRCGWILTTPAATNRTMQSLEKRGLVYSVPNVGDSPTYRLTPAGEEAIIQLKAADWEVK